MDGGMGTWDVDGGNGTGAVDGRRDRPWMEKGEHGTLTGEREQGLWTEEGD